MAAVVLEVDDRPGLEVDHRIQLADAARERRYVIRTGAKQQGV
jgi:hypothetical protein